MTPQTATMLAFGVWTVSWVAAAIWSDRPVRRAGLAQSWPYRLLTIAGVVMVARVPRRPDGDRDADIDALFDRLTQMPVLDPRSPDEIIGYSAGGLPS